MIIASPFSNYFWYVYLRLVLIVRYFCSAKAAKTVINTSPQVPSVSMLTLKLNADPQVFKLTDVVQSVNGITCEAGDGFHIDEVYFLGNFDTTHIGA